MRGPLSRQVLIKNNVDCPKIYGDPAILIANYFNPNVNKKYKLGVIPHIVDFSSVNTSKEILKINLKDDYRTVIRQILSCEHIISSSLHGLIVADAYNIPTAWVEFSDKVIGNGFKFRDYYMSINVKNPTRINLRKNKSIDNLDIIEKTDFYNNRFLSDRLLDVCPFKK